MIAPLSHACPSFLLLSTSLHSFIFFPFLINSSSIHSFIFLFFLIFSSSIHSSFFSFFKFFPPPFIHHFFLFFNFFFLHSSPLPSLVIILFFLLHIFIIIFILFLLHSFIPPSFIHSSAIVVLDGKNLISKLEILSIHRDELNIKKTKNESSLSFQPLGTPSCIILPINILIKSSH